MIVSLGADCRFVTFCACADKPLATQIIVRKKDYSEDD